MLYLLARLQAEAIATWLPGGTNATAPWLSPEECGQRLGWTDWARYQMTASLRRRLSSPMFRRQSNHAERDTRLRREMRSLAQLNRTEVLGERVRLLQSLAADSPADWVLQDQLAKCLLASGDRAGAAVAWSNMVHIVPQAFMGHYQLGLLLNEAETADVALTHLQRALEFRPFVPEVYAALGTAYTHQKRPGEADAAFQHALLLDSDHELARLAWAQSLSSRDEWVGAREQLEQAVAANTNSLAAHWHLAQLLAEHGDPSAATNHFREVLRLDPRNETARQFLSGARK